MQEARTDRAGRRPWVTLGLALTLLIASTAVAVDTVGDLGIGSTRLVDRPADPAPAGAELYVVLTGESLQPDQRAFRTSQEVVVAQLVADPAVVSVRHEKQGDGVVLIAGFGDTSTAEREQAVARLKQTIDPGALRMRVGGELERQVGEREQLEDELWRKELLVLPLALLLLVFAVGVRAAVAPALCAAIAIMGSLAALGLLGKVADISVFGVATAAAVGLVLGVELPLRTLRAPDAPERVPRLGLAVGAIGALPGFALLATPLDQAASLALGAAAAAVLPALATVLVTPAIVALLPPRSPRQRTPRRARPRLSLAAGATALIALAALIVPAIVWGDTAPYAALDRSFGPAQRLLDDSLFPELPLALAIAVGVAAALALLARDPLALLLGPLSLLPAAAGAGVCALVAEQTSLIGREDAAGSFVETGSVAIAVCALAAIGCARSASAATWLSAGRRLELVPVLVATAIGVLAAGALYATDLDQARTLAVALGAGLAADLVLVRLPVLWLVNGRVGSRGG